MRMTAVIKLATLNINAITNHTRVGILTEHIRRHDLYIVFLQEIRDPELLPMPGYDVYYNTGSDMCGTGIVARNNIMLININKLPSGRAIAVEYKGLYIVNMYAPSGTAKRTEREYFYNIEVPQLLQTGHGEIIIGATSTVYLTQTTIPAISILVGPSPR
jgi:exonuclease III